MVHLLIKFYNGWVIFISQTKLFIVFTLSTNTDFPIVISSTGEVFNQLDRAVHHNLKGKGSEKTRNVANC